MTIKTPQGFDAWRRRRRAAKPNRLLLLLLLMPCVAFPRSVWGADRQLSLKEAVDAALAAQGNASVQVAQEEVMAARARSGQSRSSLLPHLEGKLEQSRQTRNLEALGLQPSGLFRPPTLVGPFGTFDARASITQTIIDFGSLRSYQASKAGTELAQASSENVRDRTAGVVARIYLQALQAEASLEAARADVGLAESLLQLAQDRRQAGTGTRIEETRAKVQLSDQRQRKLVAENRHRRTLLLLLKATGLSLDLNLQLTSALRYDPAKFTDLAETSRIAMQSRSDLQAQRQRERTAQLDYQSARFERLPSISGFADYGTIGTSPDNSIPTWTAGLWLRLPIFDGGRIDALRAEKGSKLRQEQIKTADLERQIEVEVRLALVGLDVAQKQVEVAREGLELAQDEVEQARRRYQAGVTESIEITDAQTRLERARENQISALFSYNVARIDLAEAMGTILEEVAK